MARIIDKIAEFKILETKKDYIVINESGQYKNHGHFKKLETCYTIIRLLKNRKLPNRLYMIKAAIRITTDEKYKKALKRKQKKIKEKQRYINKKEGRDKCKMKA